MMDFFIKKAETTLDYGIISPKTTNGKDYMKWEIQLHDIIFIVYLTNYGPGDFCVSINAGISFEKFCTTYNQLEDVHVNFLFDNAPHLATVTVNTASKTIDKPHFHACDIIDNTNTWPIHMRFEIKTNSDNYVDETMLPFCLFVIKLLLELYDSNVPFVVNSNTLKIAAIENKELVNYAYKVLKQYY